MTQNKFRNNSGLHPGLPEQWRRVGSRAPATGGAWIDAQPQKKWDTRWIRLISVPSSFPRRCYLQKQPKTQQAVDFINNFFQFFCFPDLPLFSFKSASVFCFFLSDLASPSLFQAAGCVAVFRSMATQLLVSKSSASAGFAAAARGHWSCCGDGRGCWRR